MNGHLILFSAASFLFIQQYGEAQTNHCRNDKDQVYDVSLEQVGQVFDVHSLRLSETQIFLSPVVVRALENSNAHLHEMVEAVRQCKELLLSSTFTLE